MVLPNFGPPSLFSKIWLRQSLDIMVSYPDVQCQKKLMIQSWEKSVTNWRMDEQIDKRCYIECCPTNVERPKYNNLICRSFWIFLSSWISIIWLYVFGFKEQLFPTIMCKILWIYYVSPKILFWSNGLFKLIQHFIQHYENSCWMKC